MAYREFRNEATYAAPEFEGLPQTLAALDTANRIHAQRQNIDRQELENLKKLNPIAPYAQTVKEVIDDTSVIVEGYNMIKNDPKLKSTLLPKLELLKSNAESKIARANTIKGSVDRLKAQIAQSQNDNKNFKPDAINDKLTEIEDPTLTLDEREAKLNEAVQLAQNPLLTFNINKRAKDYVDEQGQVEDDSDNTYASGARIQKTSKGKFFENGVNKIGPKVIEDFLSDEDTNRYYDAVVNQKIAKDYKKIVAGQIDEIPDTKDGLTLKVMIQMAEGMGGQAPDPSMKEAAINFMKEMPELNPIDKRTPFEIKSDLIIPELKRYEDISNKNSADYSKSNPWNRYSSSGSVNTNMQFATGDTPNHGPSVVAVTKTGNVPSAKAANPSGIVKNSLTGQTSKIGGAGADVSVIDWHYGVVDKNGVPVNIPSENTEEAIKYINAAPIEEVRNWSGAFPIARGSMLNKSNIIDAKQKLQKIVTDLERRRESLTENEKGDLYELSKQLNEEDNPDFSNEIVQSYLKDIVTNVTYKMDEATATSYEAQTGINPLSKKAMTPDQKAVKDAVDKRIRNLAEEEKRIKAQKEAIEKTGLAPLPKEDQKGPEIQKGLPGIKSKVIDSAGDDLDKWSPGNQYKVGKAIYFYDNEAKEWKKK